MAAPRTLLSGIGLAAVLAGAAGVPAIASSRLWTQPWPVIALALLVGWEFAGVGLFAWWRRPENRVGLLMTIVGFAWFANGAWVSRDPLLHTIGLDLEGLYLAALAHLLLAFPSGRLGGRADRSLVVAAYLVVVLGALPALLFLDTSGGGAGAANVLLVRPEPGLARLLLLLRQLFGATVVVAIAVRLVRRWRSGSPRRRRALTPVLGTGAMVTTLTAVDLAVGASYRTPAVAVTAIHLLALLALLAVPCAYLVGLLRARFLQASAVEALVARLAEGRGVGRLRPALVRALGDESIEVAYWFAERSSYGDELGRPVHLPEPGAGRAAARIERDGRTVGAILYDAPEPDQADLVESVAGVAALAIENEQLEAALRARVIELERSRAQVMEAAESERRRLESDLHDGVQQRLVNLQLRLAIEREQPGDGMAALLDGVREELGATLAELRQLARGLHPAVLTNRGLAAAVRSLAARAPVPAQVVEVPSRRLPAAVESAAYFVVAEALTNVAKHACAGSAAVRLAEAEAELVVEVRDDGRGGADPGGSGLRGLAVRVAALDGTLRVTSPAGEGTLVQARIPLAREEAR